MEDHPITDVVFVTSPDNCPDGYKILLNCPCGHPANLWKKFVGASSEERFLCYTREDKNGMVIEDMYIPGSGDRYVVKGYQVAKRTVEGDDSLNCRYLAIKKVKRNIAKNVVYDITVFRYKDKPASCYKKLGAKLNGLYICVRIDEYKETGSSPPVKTEHPPKEPPPPRKVSPPPVITTSSSVTPQPPFNYTNTPPQPTVPVTTHPSYDPPTNNRPSNVPPTQDQPSYAPPTNNRPSYAPPTHSQPSYAPPTHNQPSYAPPTLTYPNSSYLPHTNEYSYTPPISNKPSFASNQQTEGTDSTLLLGFEHLDLDQPIPDHFQDFDDSPPDSPEPPVHEEVTVQHTYTLGSQAPPPTSSNIGGAVPPNTTSYYQPYNYTPPSTGYRPEPSLGFNFGPQTGGSGVYPAYGGPSYRPPIHQSYNTYQQPPVNNYPSTYYPPPSGGTRYPGNYHQPPSRYPGNFQQNKSGSIGFKF